MKKLLLAMVCSAALGGCVSDPLTSTIDLLSSPKAQAAAVTLGQFTKAFVCGLSAAATAAAGVEAQTYGGSAPLVDAKGQQITSVVLASSAAACTLIGGVLTSTTAVAVPASTPVVATATVTP